MNDYEPVSSQIHLNMFDDYNKPLTTKSLVDYSDSD